MGQDSTQGFPRESRGIDHHRRVFLTDDGDIQISGIFCQGFTERRVVLQATGGNEVPA